MREIVLLTGNEGGIGSWSISSVLETIGLQKEKKVADRATGTDETLSNFDQVFQSLLARHGDERRDY